MGHTPAHSDDELDVDDQEPEHSSGVKKWRSHCYKRTGRGGGVNKSSALLHMTGINSTSSHQRPASQQPNTKPTATSASHSNDVPTRHAAPRWGSNIVIRDGVLFVTTCAAWEECFHPTLGLMRRARGQTPHLLVPRESRDSGWVTPWNGLALADEKLWTAAEEIDWVVLDLRYVLGDEEYRSEEALRKEYQPESHASKPSIDSDTRASSAKSNPAHLPKVHQLTILGAEYAETMSVSRAKQARLVVQVLKGLLAVEW